MPEWWNRYHMPSSGRGVVQGKNALSDVGEVAESYKVALL